MNSLRAHICVCYLVTGTFLCCIFYTFFSTNIHTTRELRCLKEDFNEVAQLALQSMPIDESQSKHLTEMIDNILKKHLADIWDNLYAVKKGLHAIERSMGDIKCDKMARTDVSKEQQHNGRVNYASESLGARIESVVADPMGEKNILKSLLGLDFNSNPPINMLRESMEPGNCFAFKNDKAIVTVRLAKEIYIDLIEVAHTLPTVDTKSAPKSFSVYGLDSQNNNEENFLGSFIFENSSKQQMQLFTVQVVDKYVLIRLKFETNHGNPDYTCVYRIAVYGKL